MRYILGLLAIVFLTGCMTVRTYEIEKPRIDTEIEGNRGVLFGTAKIEPKKSNLGPTRKISVVEIEFGSFKKKAKEDSVLTQEIGFVGDDSNAEEVTIEQLFVPEASQDQSEYSLYTVQKNDTLQKISHKFYGTTRKWKSIYNYNKDVLKSPNKVYPGIELKIPSL